MLEKHFVAGQDSFFGFFCMTRITLVHLVYILLMGHFL